MSLSVTTDAAPHTSAASGNSKKYEANSFAKPNASDAPNVNTDAARAAALPKFLMLMAA